MWARANEKSFGACTVPFREREIRPVVYYYSRDFPERLKPDAEAMAEGWDLAFRKTVASLRAVECAEQAQGSRERCNGIFAPETTDQVFMLCGNPVEEGEHEACGPVGRRVEEQPAELVVFTLP